MKHQFQSLTSGRIVRYVTHEEERTGLGLEARGREYALPAMVVRVHFDKPNTVDLQVIPACDEGIVFRAEVSYHDVAIDDAVYPLPEQLGTWHWPPGRPQGRPQGK
tara:strand:- start:351 stop:668 length:318 start_codon:yes stop_codon:yes gene_type:complete